MKIFYRQSPILRLAILSALLCCNPFNTWSQENKTGTFIFQGIVYGYNDAATKHASKKNKQFTIEGLLNRVTINLNERGSSISTEITDENGEFSIAVPLNGIYKLILSKDGYEKNTLLINSRGIPKKRINHELTFSGAEFMLNSNVNTTSTNSKILGILYYNSQKGYFEFMTNGKGTKQTDNSLNLIRKAVQKNNHFPSKKTMQGFSITPEGIENITADDIARRRNEIEKSKAKLKEDKMHAFSKQDSLIIDAKETAILASEMELQNALKLIETQKSKIKYQKIGLYAIMSFLLLLAGSFAVFYIYYRDKKKTNQLLAVQNKNIIDSLTYAKRIQNSILIDEEEIKKVLPGIFIYYQPKDIVSGDFYWFSNIDSHLIFAVIDCTGHGVSGAFMSLIANTLLNELVNVKHISNPAVILQELHKGIVEALHKGKDDSWSYDGMDMSLCVIDRNKTKIEYAGAMQPLYIVKDNAVTVIKADMYSIGGRKLKSSEENSRTFTNHSVEIEKGMTFYMFSDGYIDQFSANKKSKFSIARFKKMLIDIQHHNMIEQKKVIQKTIHEWKGANKQIDDILVVGMRL